MKQRINPIYLMNRAAHKIVQRVGPVTYLRSSGGRGLVGLHAFGSANGSLKGLVSGQGSLSFARATEQPLLDFEGLTKTALANELRFQASRRVENLEVQNTEQPVYMRAGGTTPPAFDNATTYLGKDCASVTFVTGSNTGYGGSRVTTEDATTGGRFTTEAGKEYLFSCDVGLSRVLVGSERVTLYYTGAFGTEKLVLDAGHAANKTTWTRASVPPIVFGSGGQDWFAVYHETAILSDITVYFTKRHFEDVTGQTNQNPSEYVSVGVVASGDFHGLGVDGVQEFDYENGNTVVGDVVTEARGAAIGKDIFALYDLSVADDGAPSFDIAGNINLAQGTLIVDWVPQFSFGADPGGSHGLITLLDATVIGLLYNDSVAGAVASSDGVTSVSQALNWVAETRYRIAVRWGNGTFGISGRNITISGAWAAWDTDTFVGAFPANANINVADSGVDGGYIDMRIYLSDLGETWIEDNF